jgi:hypothetical protein
MNIENSSINNILNAFLNKSLELIKDDFKLYLIDELTLLKKKQNLFI